MEAGTLKAYVPAGFTVLTGAVGDLNGDGVQDVALVLVSDGLLDWPYSGALPMHILFGRKDGGYEVVHRFESAMVYPVRGVSWVEIEEGGLIFGSQGAGYSVFLVTQTAYFIYQAEHDMWMLDSFEEHLTNHPESREPQDETRITVPAYLQCSMMEFRRWTSMNEFRPEAFAQVTEGTITPPEGSAFQAVIGMNRTESGYEGMVYEYLGYEALEYSFNSTIRGELPPESGMEITFRAEGFDIGGDIWRFDERSRAFYRP